MARRRTSSLARVIPIRAPAPVIRVNVPRPHTPKKHHRRRSHSGGDSLSNERLMGFGMGGFAVGFIERQFPNLPTLPLIGRKGTIALGLAMFAKSNKSRLVRDAAIAAACLSGYDLGKTGSISGDDEVVRQV